MGFFDDPRSRRLKKDYTEMLKLQEESDILEFKCSDTHENYDLTFHGRVLSGSNPIKFIEKNKATISLQEGYPRSMPIIRWLTPIVHPNVSGQTVCFGNFVMSPFVKLTEICEILWDIARLALFNPHGGYSRGEEWYSLMKRIPGGVPTDPRILRNKSAAPPAPPREEPEGDMLIIEGSRPRMGIAAGPLFDPGKIVWTPGAMAALNESRQDPVEFIERHVHGDWGNVSSDDALINEEGIPIKDRIMSSYVTRAGQRIWIITETGHEVTTILLPEEY